MSLNGLQLHDRFLNGFENREVRGWIAGFCIAAVVSFALVSGLLAATHPGSSRGGTSLAVAAQEEDRGQAGVEEAESTPPSAEEPGGVEASGGADGAEAPEASASPSPTERDADFAVDPGRTDWNYEAPDEKTVYLTIDDGPSANTAAVLDILDRYGVKATFFVVGHNDDSFPMIAEAYARGHTIGLHTFTHDYGQVYASTDAFFADLDAIGQVVKGQIGYIPCFIRFPGGSSNEVSAEYCEGIMSALTEEVVARGYQYYDWNLSVGDGAEHDAAEIVGYGTEPIEGDGEESGPIMLLCHDSATKQTTVEALPAIIEHYQALGYTFKPLDRTAWVCHHNVNN